MLEKEFGPKVKHKGKGKGADDDDDDKTTTTKTTTTTNPRWSPSVASMPKADWCCHDARHASPHACCNASSL